MGIESLQMHVDNLCDLKSEMKNIVEQRVQLYRLNFLCFTIRFLKSSS